MTTPAITARGLGKCYTLGVRPKTLRDTLALLVGGERDLAGPREPFWALRGIDLEVPTGTILGVIGPNGSGKSTLLKILSRVTDPTEGRAEIRGRVASLLEVGTGFHPDLTGRDNVFLSGAILGMSRAEIARKFDEIVAFAGIEAFIDTAVKHYSSGMYVRLGFAVAAHLDADVLLVDEVLAVGDAAFQRRCLGRMRDVMTDEGRTILFVSHNLQAVSTLCTSAVLLEKGGVIASGSAREVVARYLAGATTNMSGEVSFPEKSGPGTDVGRVRAVRVVDAHGTATPRVRVGEAFSIEVEYTCGRPGTRLTPSVHVFTDEGILVIATGNLHEAGWGDRPLEAGHYRSRCSFPAEFLNKGLYSVSVFLGRDVSHVEAHARDVLAFEVLDLGGGAGRGDFAGEWVGLLRCPLPWATRRLDPGGPP